MLKPIKYFNLLFKEISANPNRGHLQSTSDIDKVIEMAGFIRPRTGYVLLKHGLLAKKVWVLSAIDEATVPFGMIDRDPYILIMKAKMAYKFCKGQYDLCTGCEIGIYYSKSTFDIPNISRGHFTVVSKMKTGLYGIHIKKLMSTI